MMKEITFGMQDKERKVDHMLEYCKIDYAHLLSICWLPFSLDFTSGSDKATD